MRKNHKSWIAVADGLWLLALGMCGLGASGLGLTTPCARAQDTQSQSAALPQTPSLTPSTCDPSMPASCVTGGKAPSEMTGEERRQALRAGLAGPNGMPSVSIGCTVTSSSERDYRLPGEGFAKEMAYERAKACAAVGGTGTVKDIFGKEFPCSGGTSDSAPTLSEAKYNKGAGFHCAELWGPWGGTWGGTKSHYSGANATDVNGITGLMNEINTSLTDTLSMETQKNYSGKAMDWLAENPAEVAMTAPGAAGVGSSGADYTGGGASVGTGGIDATGAGSFDSGAGGAGLGAAAGSSVGPICMWPLEGECKNKPNYVGQTCGSFCKFKVSISDESVDFTLDSSDPTSCQRENAIFKGRAILQKYLTKAQVLYEFERAVTTGGKITLTDLDGYKPCGEHAIDLMVNTAEVKGAIDMLRKDAAGINPATGETKKDNATQLAPMYFIWKSAYLTQFAQQKSDRDNPFLTYLPELPRDKSFFAMPGNGELSLYGSQRLLRRNWVKFLHCEISARTQKAMLDWDPSKEFKNMFNDKSRNIADEWDYLFDGQVEDRAGTCRETIKGDPRSVSEGFWSVMAGGGIGAGAGAGGATGLFVGLSAYLGADVTAAVVWASFFNPYTAVAAAAIGTIGSTIGAAAYQGLDEEVASVEGECEGTAANDVPGYAFADCYDLEEDNSNTLLSEICNKRVSNYYTWYAADVLNAGFNFYSGLPSEKESSFITGIFTGQGGGGQTGYGTNITAQSGARGGGVGSSPKKSCNPPYNDRAKITINYLKDTIGQIHAGMSNYNKKLKKWFKGQKQQTGETTSTDQTNNIELNAPFLGGMLAPVLRRRRRNRRWVSVRGEIKLLSKVLASLFLIATIAMSLAGCDSSGMTNEAMYKKFCKAHCNGPAFACERKCECECAGHVKPMTAQDTTCPILGGAAQSTASADGGNDAAGVSQGVDAFFDQHPTGQGATWLAAGSQNPGNTASPSTSPASTSTDPVEGGAGAGGAANQAGGSATAAGLPFGAPGSAPSGKGAATAGGTVAGGGSGTAAAPSGASGGISSAIGSLMSSLGFGKKTGSADGDAAAPGIPSPPTGGGLGEGASGVDGFAGAGHNGGGRMGAGGPAGEMGEGGSPAAAAEFDQYLQKTSGAGSSIFGIINQKYDGWSRDTK